MRQIVFTFPAGGVSLPVDVVSLVPDHAVKPLFLTLSEKGQDLVAEGYALDLCKAGDLLIPGSAQISLRCKDQVL